MFTENSCMFGKKRFYAPQGFLADYHDVELLKFFTDNLKKYAKKRNAMYIKIDPNVIYQVRDANGNTYPDAVADDEAINNLKKLGYHHFGFTKDYRFTQSRWNFRLPLDKDYEELKKGFSKSTRKNIDATYNKGVVVRIGILDDIESLTHLLDATAIRKKFAHRSLEYNKRMFEIFKDDLRIYIAHVDSDKYLNSVLNQIELEEKNNSDIVNKMKVDKIGNKLKSGLESSNKKLDKLKLELEEAKHFKEENPNGKDIGGMISIKSGIEYITLSSGILAEYKKFTPKYAMYNEHILDAYRFGFKYVNFYGISGIFDKSSPIYGVYEFKKGFGGNVIELIGEFSLPLSKTYYIYNLFHHIKILYRKIIKR